MTKLPVQLPNGKNGYFLSDWAPSLPISRNYNYCESSFNADEEEDQYEFKLSWRAGDFELWGRLSLSNEDQIIPSDFWRHYRFNFRKDRADPNDSAPTWAVPILCIKLCASPHSHDEAVACAERRKAIQKNDKREAAYEKSLVEAIGRSRVDNDPHRPPPVNSSPDEARAAAEYFGDVQAATQTTARETPGRPGVKSIVDGLYKDRRDQDMELAATQLGEAKEIVKAWPSGCDTKAPAAATVSRHISDQYQKDKHTV